MIGGIIAVLLGVVGVGTWARVAQPPVALGVHDGQLAPLVRANSVSTQAEGAYPQEDPLALPVGDSDAAIALVRQAIVESQGRARIVESNATYLHAEYRSRVFGFVDDLEAYVDTDAGVLHLRSGSRCGYSDFGVNQRRVRDLSATYTGLLEAQNAAAQTAR